MAFLNASNFTLERDILNISSYIFNIERILKRGETIDTPIEIPVSEFLDSNTDLKQLKIHIQQLMDFALMSDVEIDFIVKDTNKYKRRKEVQITKCDNICLFSAGVDSLSGILRANKQYDGNLVGVFVAHVDQTRNVHIYNEINTIMKQKAKIPIKILYAPPMERHGYSQIRGFLYCMYGGIYLNMMNGKRLIVSECGPTMYQPSFSPIDQVTMTTHPFVMQKTREIMKLILNRDFDLILPYENLTKAEVLMACPDITYMDKSHSCVSVGYGTHDGTCYGCIIRRLSFLAAGVKDTKYEKNPIIDCDAEQDSLLNLLRFCTDILIDYENMDFTVKENIVTYGKEDLFTRFALDVFTGIYKAKIAHGKLCDNIEETYRYVSSQIRESTFMERALTLRTKVKDPDFFNRVR